MKSTLPVISLITGTYNRVDLVLETIENIMMQTYPLDRLEHVIVADGPDLELEKALYEVFLRRADAVLRGEKWPKIVFASLGFHASSFFPASESAAPFMVAQLMASGSIQQWLSDDERMEPEHIEKLYRLMERTQSDFVYSKSHVWFSPELEVNYKPQVCGRNPPREGSITNAMYRRELLAYRGFRLGVGSGTDWDQVNGWIEAGARYAMLDDITMSHRVDKLGEGPRYFTSLPSLRGHTPL